MSTTTSSEHDDRIAAIQKQEATLQLPTFGPNDAWRLGSILVGLVQERGHRVAVRISRGEQVAFHWAAEGASLENDGWLERKSRTALRFGGSTLLVKLIHQKFGGTFGEQAWIDPLLHSAHGGAFPVIVRGTGMVAVVAVSGLTDEEDHDLAAEAVGVLLAESTAGTA